MSATPEMAAPPEQDTSGMPDMLPVFVLPSILLLPRGRLPLNIFEPHYRAMIEDTLGQRDRLIGVVQQQDNQAAQPTPALYSIGCAGRITSFAETDRGTYLISLHGISRFAIAEELPQRRGYRQVRPDWTRYDEDRVEPPHGVVERGRLFRALRHYFKVHGITANWDVIQETPDEHLVTSLAMTCPFAPGEHQALLEAPSLADRARLLLTMVEMATLDQGYHDMLRH